MTLKCTGEVAQGMDAESLKGTELPVYTVGQSDHTTCSSGSFILSGETAVEKGLLSLLSHWALPNNCRFKDTTWHTCGPLPPPTTDCYCSREMWSKILVLYIVLVRPNESVLPKRNPSPSRPLQRRLSRSSIWMPAYSILRHLDDIQRRRQRRWIRGTNCSEDSLVLDHHQLGMSMNSEESSTKFAMKGQNWLLP